MTPETFQHQAIRDLVWLLTTPRLCHCTAESWQIPVPHWDTLVQLDANPRPIEDWLADKKSTLLGHYHEHLWLFYFHIHPELELLASNLVIQGKMRTLGEFDVLLKDRRDGLIWHLELSIKFYLGTESGWGKPEAWSHWLGVACQDSMEHKWQRLLTQQLKLGEQSEVRDLLKIQQGHDLLLPDRSSAITRGYLFYPASAKSALPQPELMNPDHLKGLWMTLADWLDQYQDEPCNAWRICQKPHWMAPLRDSPWLSASALQPRLTSLLMQNSQEQANVHRDDSSRDEAKRQRRLSQQDRKPQLGTEGVLLEHQSGERLFVVSEGWPGYIPLPWHRLQPDGH